MTAVIRELCAMALAWALIALASCAAHPTRGSGGACRSLSDCKPGLVCGDGKCTRNLRDLASQTDAPPFTRFRDAGAADAGADAQEAGPENDAASTRDAGRADGG